MKNFILFLIFATNLFGIVYEKSAFLNTHYKLVYLIITDKKAKIVFPELDVKNGKLKFIGKIVGLRKQNKKVYYIRMYDINFTKSLKTENVKVLIDDKPYTIYSYQYGEIKSFDEFYKHSDHYLLNIKHKNYRPDIKNLLQIELFLFVFLYIIGRLFIDSYLRNKILKEIGIQNERISNLTDVKSLYYFVVEKDDKPIYEFMNKHLSDKQFLTGKNIDYQLMNAIFVYTKQKYIKIKNLTFKEIIIVIFITFIVFKVLVWNF